MARIHEIAPDVFSISIFSDQAGFRFNIFLVKDDEPLLYHTGSKGYFAEFSEAVASLIDISTLRWISFSHAESDECGALNDWLAIAPKAQAVTGLFGVIINGDTASRPMRPLQDNEVLTTGKKRFRYIRTPHLPHGVDAGLLFEETDGILFTSDLFHQLGDVEPITRNSLLERASNLLHQDIFANYIPYHTRTSQLIEKLALLNPVTLAVMHGSSYKGDGASELKELDNELKKLADIFNNR